MKEYTACRAKFFNGYPTLVLEEKFKATILTKAS